MTVLGPRRGGRRGGSDADRRSERVGLAPGWISDLVYPALLLPPVAVAVAVLRHRLYDLDRIVSRTLGHGPLTVLLGLGCAGVVLGLGRLLAVVAQTMPPTRASPWLRHAP